MTLGHSIVADARLAMRTLRNRLFPATDFKRWSDLRNYNPDWQERTRKIAEIVPTGASVIEFGAGGRQLETFLPSGCRYLPSDLVNRGPGTIVCDLNDRPLPDLTGYSLDVAVFGGVLEYVADLRSLASWLSRHVRMCIASYECARSAPGSIARLRESLERARIGWVNTYSEAELAEIFGPFVVSRKVPFSEPGGDGQIFVFHRGQEKLVSG